MTHKTLVAHFPSNEWMGDVFAVSTEIATNHEAPLCGRHVMPRIDMEYVYEIPHLLEHAQAPLLMSN